MYFKDIGSPFLIMHYLKFTFLCVSLITTSKWSSLGLGRTCVSGRRDPISFTPVSVASSSSSACFCPWSHPLKSWQMWNLSYPWASTHPIAVGIQKWFRSSLISLWIMCLLQKKGGEQMCKTEKQQDYDNHISLSQKGGVSVCTGVGRDKERLYAEELQKFKTQVKLDPLTVCKSFLVRIFPFGWFNKCKLDQVSIMQEIC